MLCADEENRIHELSSEVSQLQDTVQRQREELRLLEHDVSQKNAELEVVSFDSTYFFPWWRSSIAVRHLTRDQ